MGKTQIPSRTKKQIERTFDQLGKRAFSLGELTPILSANRNEWNIPTGLTTADILEYLKTHSRLKLVELVSENYVNLVRYLWRQPSPFEVAASIKKNSYFSHGSAIELHGIIDRPWTNIYINYEQSPKPTTEGRLHQENVDRAFAGIQRQSRLSYAYGERNIVIVNGKSTGQLGVEQRTEKTRSALFLTGLERTLIDITVRPNYAGGAGTVLEVYEKLKDRISIETVLSILREINYKYPYHQAIGFYMDKAGYSKKALATVKQLGSEIDFYLDYGLGDHKKYDKKWRMYYPAEL